MVVVGKKLNKRCVAECEEEAENRVGLLLCLCDDDEGGWDLRLRKGPQAD